MTTLAEAFAASKAPSGPADGLLSSRPPHGHEAPLGSLLLRVQTHSSQPVQQSAAEVDQPRAKDPAAVKQVGAGASADCRLNNALACPAGPSSPCAACTSV